MVGVATFTIRDGRVASARLYMEPVQEADPAIDAAISELTKSPLPGRPLGYRSVAPLSHAADGNFDRSCAAARPVLHYDGHRGR